MDVEKLKDLLEKPRSSDAAKTLKVKPGESYEKTINRLQNYFGINEDEKSVRIVFEDGFTGLLPRTSLFAIAAEATKGHGDSDGIMLPGSDDLQKVELCCKQPGCAHKISTVYYDPEDPYFCKLHPTSEMERCK